MRALLKAAGPAVLSLLAGPPPHDPTARRWSVFSNRIMVCVHIRLFLDKELRDVGISRVTLAPILSPAIYYILMNLSDLMSGHHVLFQGFPPL